MTHNDELDQLLGDALAEYREAEPLAGLEDRVLQRLRVQTGRRWNLWWRRSAIVAAAAALVVAAWIGAVHRVRQDVATSSVVQKQAPPVELPSPKAAVTEVPERPDSRQAPTPVSAKLSRSKAEPVREHFPSPVPLKREEQMLLALATTHPGILMPKSEDDKEIVIDPITIKPLVDETGAYQGEN